jgi:hypothetical protein
MKYHCIIISILFFLAGFVGVSQADDTGRGETWVRSRPFTLMALTMRPDAFDANAYQAAGMSMALPWRENTELFEEIVASKTPWISNRHFMKNRGKTLEEAKTLAATTYSNYPGGAGWLVWDEPKRSIMPEIAPLMSWLRQTYPETLVFTSGFPKFVSQEKLYGDTPPAEGYSYKQYLTDMVELLETDVLMYDAYIFREGGGTANLFPTLKNIREVSLAKKVPFFAFVQSHQDPTRNYRMPSESDVRMQVFANLSFGAKGIAYFTYEDAQGPAMVDLAGQPRPIYQHVAKLNQEVSKIGQSLRYLKSTDVRFVPGQHVAKGSKSSNTIPNGVRGWTIGAGGDPYIRSISVNKTNPRSVGVEKNGLVALFSDENKNRYFMLTNLHHAADLTAADASVSFVVRFNHRVKAIWVLDRKTAKAVKVLIPNHVLNWTLPGGTGDLFKYGDGKFAGIPKP